MNQPEPSLRQRLKIVALGLLLPLAILYIPYYFLLEKYEIEIFGLTAARGQFMKRFIHEPKSEDEAEVATLFLGDSTAQLSLDPNRFKDSAVNLSLSGGSAMTANHIYKRYLEDHPAPRCVFYASSYNWEQKYDEHFFENIVFFDFFNWDDLKQIWSESKEGGTFPSDTYSYSGFMTRSLLYKAKLVSPPFNLIQDWVFRETLKRIRYNRRAIRKSENHRGYLALNSNRIVPEAHFFRDIHKVYLGPFKSYEGEDYFLKRLAESVTSSGGRFYYVLLPIARSDHSRESKPYVKMRSAHIRQVFGDRENVKVLEPYRTFDREFMRDFTHLNADGAKKLMRTLRKTAPDCMLVSDE